MSLGIKIRIQIPSALRLPMQRLKNKTDDGVFVPKRAGEVNNETKYVLDFFDVETPEFIGHVGHTGEGCGD